MKKSILLLLAVAAAATGLRAQTLTLDPTHHRGVAAGLQYTAAAYGAGKYAVYRGPGSGTTAGTSDLKSPT